MPCFLERPHDTAHSALKADPKKWSDASKRSRSYCETRVYYYYDYYFWCENCFAASVYRAEEQKHDCEVEQKSIFKTRRLCVSCWQQQKDSKKELRNIEAQWRENKSELARQPEFFQNWLSHILRLKQAGGPYDITAITMLENKLKKLSDDKPNPS